MIAIWIEPHERAEALEAYRDRLSESQVDEIQDAPMTALIRLDLNICGDRNVSAVHIVEEG